MKEYEELFLNFSKLGIDEKRDAFNDELVKVAYILKKFLNKYNENIFYEPKKNDKEMTESDFLNLNYKNIYYIKSELLVLMSFINSNGDM